jgi:hypothetical protein
MKRFLKATVPLLALTGSMLIAQDGPESKRPPEKGQAEQNSQRATVGKIVKSSDGKYVLIETGGTAYQLDDQATAKKFVGKMVKVLGTVDEANDTIYVTDITPAVEQAR